MKAIIGVILGAVFFAGGNFAEAAKGINVVSPTSLLLLGGVTDCNGVKSGTAFLDNCNACVGGDTEKEPCNQDCNGDWGGTAYINTCGCVGGNTETATNVICIVSAGQIWLDRNLGASRVAISLNDEEAYGDMYQWGRGTDGHEKRNSSVTSVQSDGHTPGHGQFIIGLNVWGGEVVYTDSGISQPWQGVTGINNPCPTGFRLPTATEWNTEISSWVSNDSAGAFASPAKFPATGNRRSDDGAFLTVGSNGNYWSSTTINPGNAEYLTFRSYIAYVDSDSPTADGHSIRCIKN